ncbi:hypothetical protein [Agromyces sp. GXQ0307]|uniref:hypothetical protein n=1 Tax=Agromyces sp. GXQ0307 TaxID=3377835 RepID=UPI00383A2860
MTRRHSRTSTAGLVLRQLAAAPLPSIALALLVCGAAFLAVAAPRAVADVHTAALEARLADHPASEIDLVSTTPLGPDVGPSNAGTDLPDDVEPVWGGHEERLNAVRASLPQPLRSTTGEPMTVAVSGPVVARVDGAGPGSPRYRIQPGFDPRMREHLVLVDGAWPAPLPGPIQTPRAEAIEVALAVPVAESMAWAVGEVRSIDYTGVEVTVRLAGTVAAADPDAGFWTHLPTALRASVVDNGLSPPEYTAVAWIDPASWPDFAPFALALEMRSWIPTDAEDVRASDAPELAAQLGEFSSTSQVLGSGRWIEVDMPDAPPGTFVPYLTVSTVGTVGFTTGLRDILVDSVAAAAAVDAVLAMIASGPIGVAIAVLVLGARVVFERRRTGLELAAARGASPLRLRGVLLAEGLAIGIPSAALGAVIAVAVTPGAPGAAGWWIAAVFALTPPALLVARAPELSPLRRARADLGTARPGRARVVVEALVVLVAAVSCVLLIQRGASGADDLGVDPLLAAAPLLLALAACVLVLRIYPLPLGALVRRLARGRGLVPFLGSARALRDPSAGLVPVLAVVVGVSVAVTSTVVLSTLERGIETASERRVGADAAVAGVPLTRAQLDEMAAVDGVAAIAPIYSTTPAQLDVDGRTRSTTIIVLDREEVERVQAGRPDALDLPDELSDAVEPVPVLVSPTVATAIGAAEEVDLEGRALDVVGAPSAESPFTSRDAWIIVDRANADPFAATFVPREVLVRMTPDADPTDVVDALVAIAGDGAEGTTAAALADRLRAQPDSDGLRAGLIAAIAAATLLTALALALTLLVGQPARERLLPLLATLGLGRRGERAIVAWEIGPVTAVAIVAGVALGALVPVIVLQGVDLRGFTGGAAAPAVTFDWVLVGAVLAASVIVSAAAAAVAAHVGGRVGAARAMRKEEEG